MSCVGHDISQKLCVEIGDTDSLGQALVDQSLEACPENVHWHLWIAEEVVWPMEIIQVNVICLQSFQTLAQSCLRVVVCIVPQLRRQKNVLSSYSSGFDRRIEPFANLGLIHSDCRRVDIAIANIDDSMLNCFGILVEQSAKSHPWHHPSIAQLDCGLHHVFLAFQI